MHMPGMGGQPNIPVMNPKDFKVFAPFKKAWSPAGKLMACQWVRPPLRLDPDLSGLVLPERLKIEDSGLKYSTAVLRVIAAGNKCEFIKDDDLIFISNNVTVHLVSYQRIEYTIVHEDGIFGRVDEGKDELWQLMVDPVEGE